MDEETTYISDSLGDVAVAHYFVTNEAARGCRNAAVYNRVRAMLVTRRCCLQEELRAAVKMQLLVGLGVVATVQLDGECLRAAVAVGAAPTTERLPHSISNVQATRSDGSVVKLLSVNVAVPGVSSRDVHFVQKYGNLQDAITTVTAECVEGCAVLVNYDDANSTTHTWVRALPSCVPSCGVGEGGSGPQPHDSLDSALHAAGLTADAGGGNALRPINRREALVGLTMSELNWVVKSKPMLCLSAGILSVLFELNTAGPVSAATRPVSPLMSASRPSDEESAEKMAA